MLGGWGGSNHIFKSFVWCLLASVLPGSFELSCRKLSLSSGSRGSRVSLLGSPHLLNSYTVSPGLSHIALIHPQAQSSPGARETGGDSCKDKAYPPRVLTSH